mmetsp:Transcript_95160/g.255480  ORF Transcript_95160/g.255480 Transcript_95160/m.255480 type:complete len:203 (+) Transcript_95160:614-1222(+)
MLAILGRPQAMKGWPLPQASASFCRLRSPLCSMRLAFLQLSSPLQLALGGWAPIFCMRISTSSLQGCLVSMKNTSVLLPTSLWMSRPRGRRFIRMTVSYVSIWSPAALPSSTLDEPTRAHLRGCSTRSKPMPRSRSSTADNSKLLDGIADTPSRATPPPATAGGTAAPAAGAAPAAPAGPELRIANSFQQPSTLSLHAPRNA